MYNLASSTDLAANLRSTRLSSKGSTLLAWTEVKFFMLNYFAVQEISCCSVFFLNVLLHFIVTTEPFMDARGSQILCGLCLQHWGSFSVWRIVPFVPCVLWCICLTWILITVTVLITKLFRFRFGFTLTLNVLHCGRVYHIILIYEVFFLYSLTIDNGSAIDVVYAWPLWCY